MNKNEDILKQYEQIQRIILSSHGNIFSSATIFCIGLLVFLVPVIEKSTTYLTFGYHLGDFHTWWCVAIHIAFYMLLSFLISKTSFGKKDKENEEKLHPLIKKSLEITAYIGFSNVACVSILIPMGYGRLALPLTFLFLGILYYVLGKFSNKYVRLVSYLFTLTGVLHIYLLQYKIPNLEWILTMYMGLCIMFAAKVINKNDTQ